MEIDTSLDLSTGYRRPKRHDPDRDSPTMRLYHQALWSKPLPSGAVFRLDASGPKSRYLVHDSELGRFRLTSDAITTRMNKGARKIIAQIAPEDLPPHAGYTIGSAIVFPANRVDGKRTINAERGCNRKIADRFDLTLECIRRYYLGISEPNPLFPTLQRYAAFFDLFEDFDGYVRFFLLEDLVDEHGRIVEWLPFDDFRGSGLPRDVDEYLRFRDATLRFVEARNARIDRWAKANLS